MSELNEIAAALAKAQAEMSNPSFDSTNPHFRNRFASLAAVRNAVVPALSKHGISLVQDITTTEHGISCRTILTHSSGQQMTFGPLVLPATKQDAQGFGSAATYARRYTLMAVAGVVGDDDDDANAATGKNSTAPRITDNQAADINALITEVGANRDSFLKYFHVNSVEAIPADAYSDAVAALERKRKRA